MIAWTLGASEKKFLNFLFRSVMRFFGRVGVFLLPTNTAGLVNART